MMHAWTQSTTYHSCNAYSTDRIDSELESMRARIILFRLYSNEDDHDDVHNIVRKDMEQSLVVYKIINVKLNSLKIQAKHNKKTQMRETTHARTLNHTIKGKYKNKY